MSAPANVEELVASCRNLIGGPITALRRIASGFGHIEPAHIDVVAEQFNISCAEVRGIVGFYSDLNTEPRGNRHIRICQAEACQSVGARRLTESVVTTLDISLGETTADGAASVDAVYCLGVCASGPAAMVDGTLIVHATPERLLT